MNILQAIILGIVQGATEFIPVSSSGHLVLVPWLLGWPNPGLAFDTILHLGTLLAVVAVFWRDLLQLAIACLCSLPALPGLLRRSGSTAELKSAAISPEARLAWWIILATIPAGVMGLLWEDQFEALFSSPLYVAAFLLVTGLWLIVAERLGHKQSAVEDLKAWQALLIGVAQGCAIAPGISRSGATIGAGLLLGLRREAATRFSFLLSAPIILATGLLQIKKLLESGGLGANWAGIALGFLAAFVTGYVCIRFLLRYVRERGLAVFAAYCWALGLMALAAYLLR